MKDLILIWINLFITGGLSGIQDASLFFPIISTLYSFCKIINSTQKCLSWQNSKSSKKAVFSMSRYLSSTGSIINGHKVLFLQSVNEKPCQINYILFTSRYSAPKVWCYQMHNCRLLPWLTVLFMIYPLSTTEYARLWSAI